MVDPSVVGQSHLLVNLGFIDLCLGIFSDVEVVAEETHCAALVHYGADRTGRVTFHPYKDRRDLSVRRSRVIDPASPTEATEHHAGKELVLKVQEDDGRS